MTYFDGLYKDFVNNISKHIPFNSYVRLEDFAQFYVALTAGIVIGILVMALVLHNVKTDNSLKNIAVIKITEKNKTTYFVNLTKDYFELIATFISVLYLKITRKKAIQLSDYKKARIVALILILYGVIALVIGMFLVSNVLDIGDFIERK